MANPFLVGSDHSEIETAIIYEKAKIHNIGNAVAYTDGDRLYVNTEDNLAKILPDYNQGMLKWLLWHEKYHMELKHHNRFFKYLKELSAKDTEDEFKVTKDEVNIIMDILVHDSLSKLFPELVEIAVNNLAQMRNQNSLKYTFKTSTLEEMLTEYAEYKKDSDTSKGEDKTEEDDAEETTDGDSTGDGEGGKDEETDSKTEDKETKIVDDTERPEPTEDKHDETDWSKLDEIDSKEFLDEGDDARLQSAIERLKRKKFKLAKLTETLNGLVTSTRKRSYTMPSTVHIGDGVLLKGSTPGRTKLYLIFDASGSMSSELATFKEIISKSIPQAMETPCEWFAGDNAKIKPYKTEHMDGYYKGKFKDIMPVYATSGYDDDGDRTIELCWQAEQQGYSPIGVTDGGGQISWSKDKLKQLKRTVLIGHRPSWLETVKRINPNIQTLDI